MSWWRKKSMKMLSGLSLALLIPGASPLRAGLVLLLYGLAWCFSPMGWPGASPLGAAMTQFKARLKKQGVSLNKTNPKHWPEPVRELGPQQVNHLSETTLKDLKDAGKHGKEIILSFSPFDFPNFLAEGDFRKKKQQHTNYAVKSVPFHFFDKQKHRLAVPWLCVCVFLSKVPK